ncbi:MAG: NF038122 family metalloprotease [Blastocatellia bacterium]|nr:NF038122 family metalloprotease [Blastocatellia bacterium]
MRRLLLLGISLCLLAGEWSWLPRSLETEIPPVQAQAKSGDPVPQAVEAVDHVLWADESGVRCLEASPELTTRFDQVSQPVRLRALTPLARQADGFKITLLATDQLIADKRASDAFLRAAATWESLIQTPISVQIRVDFGPTRFGTPYSPNVLGSTSSQQVVLGAGGYTKARTALVNRTMDPDLRAALDRLPTDSVKTDLGPVMDVQGTSINFRALGLLPPAADPDAEIQLGSLPSIGFNSAFDFDFDPADGIGINQTDFDGVAVHEIGHALGFISQVDNTSTTTLRLTTWDLFRFRPKKAKKDFTGAERVRSQGGEQVYTLGRKKEKELPVSTGTSGGDGRQASHWKDDALRTDVEPAKRYLGVMDPALPRGFRQAITPNDLKVLTSIGYTLRPTALEVLDEAQGSSLPPPQNLTAVRTGTRVDVKWQPPAGTGQVEQAQQNLTEVEPNNGFATAQAIPSNAVITGTAQASDAGEYVLTLADGSKDDFEDVYRLTLTQTSKVSIKLSYSPGTADLDVWLLKNETALTILDDDGASDENPETTTVELGAGSYLIAVSTFEPGPPTPAQDGQYTLTVTSTPTGNPTPKVQSYNLYRSTSPSVAVTTANRIAFIEAPVVTFADTVPPSDGRTIYYYVVTAVYAAGESGPSNEASTNANPSDTTPPTVKVTAPNGGESFNSGATIQITWTATDNGTLASQDIALSTDGGNSFPTSVATGLSNTTFSFAFNSPATLQSTTARIRVTARDAAGNSGLDTSDGNFSIVTRDSTAPQVKVLSPNTKADKLKAGKSFQITWQSSDNVGIVSHDILLSLDGGASFPTVVANGLPGSAQSFVFAVPANQTGSKTGRIRVRARDAAGNLGQDDSDENLKVKGN